MTWLRDMRAHLMCLCIIGAIATVNASTTVSSTATEAAATTAATTAGAGATNPAPTDPATTADSGATDATTASEVTTTEGGNGAGPITAWNVCVVASVISLLKLLL